MGSLVKWAWTSNKKMKTCPFCGKKNTYCTVETTNIETENHEPVFNAIITCHICGCTVHELDPDKDMAVTATAYKWEHRAGDKE